MNENLLSGSGKLTRSNIKYIGDLNPPELINYGDSGIPAPVSSIQFDFTEMWTWIGIRQIILIDNLGNELKAGIDWTVEVSGSYNSSYLGPNVYTSDNNYWCSVNYSNHWLKITLKKPTRLKEVNVIVASSYVGGKTDVDIEGHKKHPTRTLISGSNIYSIGDQYFATNYEEIARYFNLFKNNSIREVGTGVVFSETSTLNKLTHSPNSSQRSIWGSLLGGYVTRDSDFAYSVLQSLLSIDHYERKSGSPIYVRRNPVEPQLKYHGETYNGIVSNDYGKFDQGHSVSSIIYFDSIIGWYVDYDPLNVKMRRFDPIDDLVKWSNGTK